MRLFISIILFLFLLSISIQVNSQNLLNGPDDLVFDLKYNRTLVGNWAGNRIIAIDSNGNQTVYKTGLQYCHGMELSGDTLYVSSANKIYLININDAQTIRSILVPGSSRLGAITMDTANYILYVSDWSVEKIFKVNLNSNTSSILLNPGYGIYVGILFDGNNNRLILNTFNTNVPIKAVNITTGQVSNLTGAIYNNLSAIIRDKNGYVYFTSFATDEVYKIDSSFAYPHQIISTGHDDPSGLGYNMVTHTLGVTNYNTNSISLITLPGTSIRKIGSSVYAKDYELYQNYPNPFNSTTIIKFNIKNNTFVELKVFDILGKEIAKLVNEKLQAGTYEASFSNNQLPSGGYIYKLETENYSNVKKMMLIK